MQEGVHAGQLDVNVKDHTLESPDTPATQSPRVCHLLLPKRSAYKRAP